MSELDQCPCQSGKAFETCCGPLLAGAQPAPTAEALMRSRYVAFAKNDMDYVERTTHPKSRGDFDRKSSEEWAGKSEWLGLEILDSQKGQVGDEDGTVEFVARYRVAGQDVRHHEFSQFAKDKGVWYFVDGKTLNEPFVKAGPKVGRNDPCPCGSGKKYKKCCGAAA